MSSERRTTDRVELLTSIQYSVVLPASETGLIKNISKTGLCIIVDRRLSEGSVLRVEFDLPGDKPEHIQALAEIVWVKTVGNKYSCGLRFISR